MIPETIDYVMSIKSVDETERFPGSSPSPSQKRLPPGARAQPDQIIPILETMHAVSAKAESAASNAAARLRELRGTRSPAAAGVAATAHELSLEKDTWALLVFMNLADQEEKEIEGEVRRDEEEANSGSVRLDETRVGSVQGWLRRPCLVLLSVERKSLSGVGWDMLMM